MNEEEIKKLKSDYPDFFEQLPPDFLDFIFSEETSSEIAEICLENNVADEEKIEKIAYQTTLALLGQIPEENLTEILEKNAELDYETAEKIAGEIKQRFLQQTDATETEDSLFAAESEEETAAEIKPETDTLPDIKAGEAKKDTYRELAE